MKGSHIAIFAAGGVCTLLVVVAGLWFSGLLVLGSSDAEAQGDPITETHAPDTPKPKEQPEDTTDLGKLKVMELAQYYDKVRLGKINRKREDIRAAIAKLTPEDIDLMCASFLKEPTGPGLTKYALVLSDVGTEKALRTLGTFYKRPDLKNGSSDYSITLCISSTVDPVARDVLKAAFESHPHKEMRKLIALGLGRFRGDEELSGIFIERIPLVDEDESQVLMMSLGAIGTDEGVEYLKSIARGKYPKLDNVRSSSVNAFRRSSHPRVAEIVREIAFDPDCQDEKTPADLHIGFGALGGGWQVRGCGGITCRGGQRTG